MNQLAEDRKLHDRIISSDFLGQNQQIQISLPPRYSPLRSFPLLIVLDGDDYRLQGRYLTQLSEFQIGNRGEWITVFVPCSKEERSKWYHPHSDDHLKFQQFLFHELLADVEDSYSTWRMGAGRGLLGSSLSATLSLSTAFHYPHSFQKVCAQSAFLPEDSLLEWFKTLPVSTISPLHLYLSAGEEERDYLLKSGEAFDFLEGAFRFTNLFQTHLLDLTFEKLVGGHSWGSWQLNLPRIFSFLETHWS